MKRLFILFISLFCLKTSICLSTEELQNRPKIGARISVCGAVMMPFLERTPPISHRRTLSPVEEVEEERGNSPVVGDYVLSAAPFVPDAKACVDALLKADTGEGWDTSPVVFAVKSGRKRRRRNIPSAITPIPPRMLDLLAARGKSKKMPYTFDLLRPPADNGN